jgi:hypothetical protein
MDSVPDTLRAGVAAGRPDRYVAHVPVRSLLDLGDGQAGIEALRAGLGAVHDGVAAIEAERVLELVEPLAGPLIARIGDPAVGLQQYGGAQITVAVPPVAGARRGARETQDALVEPVQFLAFGRRLQPLAVWRVRVRLEPGLDRGQLRVGVVQVRNQILDDVQMRQRIDFDGSLDLVDVLGTGQRVGAVDIHRTGTAYALAAGAPEGERRIDLVLDLVQRVQDHRPAIIQVDFV